MIIAMPLSALPMLLAAAGNWHAHPTTRRCVPIGSTEVRSHEPRKPRAEPLGDQPPAKLYLGVEHLVAGCEKPIIVAKDVVDLSHR